MKLKVVVTGAGGLLGQALQQAFGPHHEVAALRRQDLDVTELEAVRTALCRLRPDWVVHAAAFTRVDEAESRALEAYRVNALGSRNLAAAASDSGARLLYCSTDYVFDGEQRHPYLEWDPPGPLNLYGKSKLAGEWFVRSLCPHHLILRTGWLFGPGGAHFVEKVLRRASQGETLKVVSDQRGTPTFTPDLAHSIRHLIEQDRRGTYHVSNRGECSWFEFAGEILRLKNLRATVQPISSSELAAAAARPAYSVLDNFMLKMEGTALLRPWQTALADYLS